MLVARAVQKGQMDGAGEDSSMSGSASVSVLTITSRRSPRIPAITGISSRWRHRGERLVTMGIRLKFCGGGGDVVAHSRVSASQGLSPAGAPAIRLRLG